jgi:hypothetical protein
MIAFLGSLLELLVYRLADKVYEVVLAYLFLLLLK